MASPLAQLFVTIGADTAGYEAGLHRVNTSLSSLDSGLNKIAKFAAIGAVAVVGGFAAISVALGKTVMAAADMEQQLANIQAAMGLTSEETAKLKGLIEDLGLDPNLQVSATEAAAAIEMLGKNGLTVDQILQGAARSTVLLANATGADFALAADVATSAMLSFGINADEMGSVVSSISGALVQSKFDINDYALALAQGGGVAAAVGMNFEDFNTTIAAISPLFASGSDAGTSLKTMLQRLIPASNDATDAMRSVGLLTGMSSAEFEKAQEKLGKVNAKIAALDPTSKTYEAQLKRLTAEQTALSASLVMGQNAFFNIDGSMKSGAEIAGILARAFNGLTDAQKNEKLATIFGTDAMRAAVAMSMVGQDEFTRLKDVIGETDAEEQAATRMDTLKGKIEILRGVVEAISLKIGEKFIPAVKLIADWMLKLITDHEPQIDAFFGTFADKVQTTVETVIENWPEISKALQEGWKVIQEVMPKVEDVLKKFSGWFSSSEGKRPMEWFVRFVASGAVFFRALGEIFGEAAEAIRLFGDAWSALMHGDFSGAATLARRAGNMFTNAGMSGADMDRAVEDIMTRVYGARANGGWAGGMTLVGERGPELVDLPNGSYVHTATESRGMMTRQGTQITIQNLNLAGSGDAGQDVRNAVAFLNTAYSYGY